MLITKKSLFTGKKNTRDVDITHEQIARWQGGELIQDVVPHLSVDDREFLLTGATPEEWKKFFG